jgi:glutathione S-transferase
VTQLSATVRLSARRAYVRGVRELFHIALPEDWAAAQRAGEVTDSTRGVTLDQQGYIHCSYAEQVAATAGRFYGDLDEVVVLRIDPAQLSSPVVEEDLADSGEPFPHVYGPIELGAVVEARALRPGRADTGS